MSKTPRQIRTRPAWERMIRIHQAIQRHEYPNSHQISRDMEVALRTAKRDLEFMRVRLKLPMAYDSMRWGFYYTKPVEEFPSLPISEGDVFALLVARKAIEQYACTPFQKLLEGAYSKLTGQLDAEARFSLGELGAAFSFRPFAPEDADLKVFERLTQAVRERREVRFKYRKLEAKRWAWRRVWPYHVACVENHWYLFAFDVARQAVRTFVLGRLKEVELTGKQFVPPARFDLNEHLRGSLGVFKGTEDHEVVIQFDPWAADLVRGRRWHLSQELSDTADGGVQLRLKLNSLEEAERWILSWGTHATVVKPKRLATRIRKVAKALANRYRDQA